jgi:guanylate kinase
MNAGKIIVISGPSGVGKTTLYKKLLAEMPEKLEFSVSVTTRAPRQGEKNGVDYFFVSMDEFRERIAHDALVEYAEVYGNLYGTPKSEIDRITRSGKNCLLDLDVQGGRNIKKCYPESILVFINPPSLDELKSRIMNRNLDRPEQIARRLAKAMEEMSVREKYDYQIVNADIDKAYSELKELVKKIVS